MWDAWKTSKKGAKEKFIFKFKYWRSRTDLMKPREAVLIRENAFYWIAGLRREWSIGKLISKSNGVFINLTFYLSFKIFIGNFTWPITLSLLKYSLFSRIFLPSILMPMVPLTHEKASPSFNQSTYCLLSTQSDLPLYPQCFYYLYNSFGKGLYSLVGW